MESTEMPRRRHEARSPSELPLSNKVMRGLWGVAWLVLFRPSPRPLHGWRCFLLRLFGASIGRGVLVYQSVRVWAPWNLEMADGSCLGDWVDCYSVDKISLGRRAIVSQYSYLCTATHDFSRRDRPLVTRPIVIGDDAWVTADVFIGPGVKIGEGTVVGARSTVVRDLPPWSIAVGSPARVIGKRELSH